jgi:hypothetical protein
VWNGHLECVKFIASNPWGVDKEGNRCSVLDLMTCKGYTALHLACLDCPAPEGIVKILLVSGCNEDLRDDKGMTPYDYALENVDSSSKHAFHSLHSDEIEMLQKELFDNYTFASNRRWNVEESVSADFRVPDFIYKEQTRKPYIPESLRIHDHHILPLIQYGQSLKGVTSLRCLEFVKVEADHNRERREKLLKAYDSTWTPPINEDDPLQLAARKGRSKKKAPKK